MDDGTLIVLVQQYKELYDCSDNNYMNNLRRLNAWDEIAEKMKSTAEDCKRRWGQLRDNYRRAKTKADKTTTGQAAGGTKRIRRGKELSFLDGYIFNQRRQLSNFAEECNLNITETNANTAINPPAASNASSSTEHAPNPSGHTPSTSKKDVMKTGRQQNITAMAEYFKLKNEFYAKNVSALENTKRSDHLTKYFESVEETVRNPSFLQMEAKAKISSIIHELEAKAVHMAPSMKDNQAD